jgi:SAM-dependent methyltransferase
MRLTVSDGARQKLHYEAIHSDYEDHYYDSESMAFRERFYYDPLFAGLDLNYCSVADLASGSGHTSLAVLRRFQNAAVTGFDISRVACEAYRHNVGKPCLEADLTKPFEYPDKFDFAVIVGGLHHCVADLPIALRNVAQLLKPGGRFLLLEPNMECVLEGARRLWYRTDKYFDAKTERALSHSEILHQAGEQFRGEGVGYYGGPGYFLISQSLLFRIPKPVKRVISPPLMVVEALFNRVSTRWIHPYFIARWVRNSDKPA